MSVEDRGGALLFETKTGDATSLLRAPELTCLAVSAVGSDESESNPFANFPSFDSAPELDDSTDSLMATL